MRSQNRARETSIRGFGCGRQANACEKPFRSPLTLDFGDFSGVGAWKGLSCLERLSGVAKNLRPLLAQPTSASRRRSASPASRTDVSPLHLTVL